MGSLPLPRPRLAPGARERTGRERERAHRLTGGSENARAYPARTRPRRAESSVYSMLLVRCVHRAVERPAVLRRALLFGLGAIAGVVAGDEQVDRRQEEQREERADEHAAHQDTADAVAGGGA